MSGWGDWDHSHGLSDRHVVVVAVVGNAATGAGSAASVGHLGRGRGCGGTTVSELADLTVLIIGDDNEQGTNLTRQPWVNSTHDGLQLTGGELTGQGLHSLNERVAQNSAIGG